MTTWTVSLNINVTLERWKKETEVFSTWPSFQCSLFSHCLVEICHFCHGKQSCKIKSDIFPGSTQSWCSVAVVTWSSLLCETFNSEGPHCGSTDRFEWIMVENCGTGQLPLDAGEVLRNPLMDTCTQRKLRKKEEHTSTKAPKSFINWITEMFDLICRWIRIKLYVVINNYSNHDFWIIFKFTSLPAI